jgi:hypothetical protein
MPLKLAKWIIIAQNKEQSRALVFLGELNGPWGNAMQ